MYEAEVNNAVESIEVLPLDIRRLFAEHRDKVTARTFLPWGEHCTECVWPVCYTTCELYSPRIDGACRQFVDGMVRIDHKEGLSPYLLKIRFKQWGKLWAIGNVHLQPLSRARRIEQFNIAVGAIGRNLPVPHSVKPRVLRKLSYLRTRAAGHAHVTEELPDCFLLECYNPSSCAISLTVIVKLRGQQKIRPFQTVVKILSGYNRARIDFSDISQAIDICQPFEIEIVPDNCNDLSLYFGLMDFVKERVPTGPVSRSGPEHKVIKCIVWDLDNTLWNGILVEDGPEKIRIRQDVLDVIKRTDQRGILHSIASKNSPEEAARILRVYDIDEYFLYPQIGWHPKSQSIARIAQLLNIGTEAVAFVDDQQFEREEVKTALPEVTVIDAAFSAQIPERPECLPPVTAESKRRRLMYREQQRRQTALESFTGDYKAFVRECRMEIRIRPINESNVKRVYELAQRTNQLNFTGHRYPERELIEIMRHRVLETYVVDCSDRFGNYGIVGLAVVDSREPRLVDLMFSCRIQSKRVEHAVLSYLLKRFAGERKQDFYANYRKTATNAPAGQVFDELGFECVADNDGVLSLVFKTGREIPDDHIIRITEEQAT